MQYMKVFTDFLEALEPLGDAERGRLFTAMLVYVQDGTIPEFRGNERFIWPMAKSQLDRNAEEYRRKCENGAKGGRPRKTEKNLEKPKKTKRNLEKPSKTKKNQEQEQEQEQEQDQDNISPPHIPPAGGWGVPDGPLLSALKAFEEMRKRIKKPMTQRARELLLGNLKKLSSDEGEQVKILEQSILKGWQDVYPLHDRSEPAGKATSYDLDLIKAAMMGVPK